jgi:serine/threonine protein kinase
MVMTEPRWSAVSEPGFPWEREALDYVREHLPNHDPWQAWSNFEFLDDDGKLSEVDALVLSPRRFWLVEIKSRPGRIEGDAHSWTWTTEGLRYSDDNPLILANRKAKRLASLLRRQPAVRKAHVTVPFIEPLIFLSARVVDCRLDAALRRRVRVRDRPGVDGVIAALTGLDEGEANPSWRVDSNLGRIMRRAIAEAGIRPALRQRRIGDYELERLIAEGEDWQDWDGKHVSARVHRRIRLFPYPVNASDEGRRAGARLVAREFEILQGIRHPGILEVLDFKESDRGPALVFEHDPDAVRLDFLLRHHLERMAFDLRFDLLRQIAETVKYAHDKRLFHRSLSPQSILVRDVSQPRPLIQVMNWRMASRDRDGSRTSGSLPSGGTTNLADYIEDPAKVYLAPEVLSGTSGTAASADIFSLGAIAWHLFTGRPPADGPLELLAKLREKSGLRLSEAIDGVSSGLETLVHYATHPDIASRISSADEFLEYLADAERDRPPTAESDATVDPSQAKEGDRLDGGFLVLRRLGRGASADVLLVKRDRSDGEMVLKVAIDMNHAERLIGEGEVLGRLRHQNIVRHYETLTVAGRSAILMARAGEKTLAQVLKSENRPTLDLVQRYGEELLDAVDYLEQTGVAHRDIKPDNIGIAQPEGGRYRLILFDFSLTRTPLDNIQAGTRPYLDPFLPLRRRWDIHADRFAAAVTLYEMLTGSVPVWGDGLTDPAALPEGGEAVIDSDRFDPALRDGLITFFAKAFCRDVAGRFDNAEEMLRAWRRIFESARPSATEEGESALEGAARHATMRTPVTEFGFSVEALDVLSRMGIHNAQRLLEVPRVRFRYLSGVSERVRQEIRRIAKELERRRPDLAPGAPSPLVNGTGSLDRLAEQLVPKDDRLEDQLVGAYLGIEPPGEGDGDQRLSIWPAAGAVASRCGTARSALAKALEGARERWLKLASLNALRTEMATLLDLNGGVMTAAELARQILAMRGSRSENETERLRLALAVLRGAVEAEAGLAQPRFSSYEEEAFVLIASTIDAAIYAQALGREADVLAEVDPPPAPVRVQEALERVIRPEGLPPLPPHRLPRLAVAASHGAALSARHEIYPRDLPAERAVTLAVGSLLGPRRLTEEQVRERVLGRFPEAAALPPRPALDALLQTAGTGRVWREDDERGPGYYLDPAGLGLSTAGAEPSRSMTSGPPVEETAEVEQAHRFETVLERARRSGGFLAIAVSPRLASRAEAELQRRFTDLERLSLDTLLIEALREEAAAKRVDWSMVLRADAAPTASRDRQNLGRLVGLAAPRVEQLLLSSKRAVLLANPGLLARYGCMSILARLGQSAGSANGPPAAWVLVPMAQEGLPAIDGVPVPVIGAFQWARLPEAWACNMHCSGTA